MSLTEKKRTSVLNPSLLQFISQTFSQSIPTTSSPSDQLSKLSVNTPTTTSSSIEIILDVPQTVVAAEFVDLFPAIFKLTFFFVIEKHHQHPC